MNFKKLLLGTALAMSTVNFMACSDDSTAAPTPSGPTSSAAEEIHIRENTDLSPIKFETISAQLGGNKEFFKGNIQIDILDTLSSENPDQVYFTNVEFTVGRIENDKAVESTAQVVFNPIQPQMQTLNLQEMGVSIDFSDPSFTDCGTYVLMVTATASDDAGKPDKFVTTGQSEKFQRPEAYCKSKEPESSAAVEVKQIEMETYEVTLETNGKKGLNLAAGTTFTEAEIAAGNAVHFTLDNVGGVITINSQNGTLFSPITNGDDNINYDDDWSFNYYPETELGRSAYVSDFQYKDISGTSIDPLDQTDLIYVAKATTYDANTGAGFFAFVLIAKQELTNKDYSMTFKVYKAK